MPEPDIPFIYGNGNGRGPTTMVVIGDGRSRVRRVVKQTTRHVTVVSYTTNHTESRTHTSHHVTTVSFPQKVAERQPITPAYAIQGNSGGYVYLQQQQHYTPPPQLQQQQQQQQQIIYQHQMCPSQMHPGHQLQTLHKKGSIRNGGDVMKRTRQQNPYELSQDLLDKQIELLERKYGGICARTSAITIQRAFRHYTMVKKFASITAMAKAEKRLSRRMMPQDNGGTTIITDENGQQIPQIYTTGTGTREQETNLLQQQQQQQQQQRVCATITANPATLHAQQCRITPVRSMSLRERRSLDASPIPRSQSGNASPMPTTCWSQSPSQQQQQQQQMQQQHHQQQYNHPHVNILHAEQHYYSSPIQGQYHHLQYQQQQQQQQQQLTQFNPNNNDIDSPHSMNSSWVNSTELEPWMYLDQSNIEIFFQNSQQMPHTPYYSAAQIYMRPRVVGSSGSGGCGGGGGGGNNSSSSNSSIASKRVPPEVPKRTSSITGIRPGCIEHQHQHHHHHTQTGRPLRPNGLCKTAENGSLSSVQSSGSDSSASTERIQCEISSDRSNSPQWKLKSGTPVQVQSPDHINNQTDTECLSSHTTAAQYSLEQHDALNTPTNYKISETIRKRQYRVGLNLFNKKPEKGITYLIRRGFLENTPQGVARFLISRKGLSRQMIGEYLGNLQNSFNMAVLDCFAGELDLSGMQVDVALRKFQAYFRMPGEAQKIERLMEIYSQRYCQCNTDIISRLRSQDTVFVLAFAIIMLNTDLHTPNIKAERRMRIEDFIKNLRGIDDCHDIERDMLVGVYERVKANEFKPGSDHVTQVMKVQATIVGKKPNLALPHRRLVCYCRLYEIPDINKKERPGVHQREVFLFNDLLVITKIFSKKKSSVTYTFRNSFPLVGMVVTLLDVPNYPYCIRLTQKVDGKILVTFNARNEHDRCKFAEDLRESISEMDEMESLRIEGELDRQKSGRGGNRSQSSENRDSGVADVEVCPCPFQQQTNDVQHDQQLKRSALSNSLLDMHEQFGVEKPQRRGSVGSLDSGMSISFQSTSASTGSRSNDSKTRIIQQHPSGVSVSGGGGVNVQHPQSFLGGIFQKRERKPSRSEDTVVNNTNTTPGTGGSGGHIGRSTEV